MFFSFSRKSADNLDYVMFRMGILANIRSRVKGGLAIGVMITASHNPEQDNGVKLVDPKGEMLEQSWEKYATDVANVEDDDLEAAVTKIIKLENIDLNCPSNVFIGMDTRYHSPILAKAVGNGVLCLKGNIRDFGICTTPMLHYFVVCKNSSLEYGLPTEEGYFNKLVSSFQKLFNSHKPTANYVPAILFDGANGVGSLKCLQFARRLKEMLTIKVFNSNGKINHECGADYVKVLQKVPSGLPESEPFTRCVSVDGDADRIVYFFQDDSKKFYLLDGDRIATLIAEYFMDLLKLCNVDLKIGLVQTAYANGASTDYIEKVLKVPVACVPTGVKHLHHKALCYDVGIYFEANGHGTVVFSDFAKKTLRDISTAPNTSETVKNAADTMLSTIDLINETVGDALSDMLLVEIILHSKDWDLRDWLARYVDLPNLQLKVKVKDRNLFQTADAERKCVQPEGLQAEIDLLVAKYSRGRSFVRASGTEDVVRVYAEAETKEDTRKLAVEVANLVFDMGDGIGEKLLA